MNDKNGVTGSVDTNQEDQSNQLTVTQGGIIQSDISSEMKSAYLDYAMSVIVSRALPDIRDGLKPVHRRIIYAMYDQHMVSSGKFHKSAAVVGEVLKMYHPHGDAAVYDSMVRMAQPFSLRYPLVLGQGNFGSIDGDPPAAMRYTEAKLAPIADELYRDIDAETVKFELNDLQNMEPTVLPSVIPNLLLNGVSGIAVGMATNIPPHNLSEIIDGINLMIEKASKIGEKAAEKDRITLTAFEGPSGSFETLVCTPDFSSDATTEDLVSVIKGPDFPTGGIIYDQKEIIQMYATGKGKIVTRARITIEETKSGKTQIVVTEIPYQVNKATLISKIAEAVKDKKIVGISDLRDESSKDIRIVIELKKDALPKKVENSLYKHTQLQNSFNTNMVALVDGEPKLLTLKTIIEEFIRHRQRIVINRTLFLLRKARAREHILLGLKIALDNLDEVIKLIRASKDQETAKTGLMTKFGLTEIQATAILDMQLRKLAALERQKIEDELKQIQLTIADFNEIVSTPQRIIDIVKKELTEIKEKYGDERRTRVVKSKVGEINDEDLISDETCIVTVSQTGYIKRIKADIYKRQARGGKGVSGQTLKDEDLIDLIRTSSTHDNALFFTNKGRVYKLKIWEIPESSRQSKGTAVVNFLNISQDEKVQAFLTLTNEEIETANGYLVFATSGGTIKKTDLSEFTNIRSSGIKAINLSGDESLVNVVYSSGEDDVMIITQNGQSIRFSEDEARPMGRSATGVAGIRLTKGDRIVSLIVINKESKDYNLVVVTANGYGKKTDLNEYKTQGRGGSGILTYKVTEKTGNVVSARIQPKKSNSDIIIASTSGKIIRLEEKAIPLLGRATLGVRLIKLAEQDHVSSVAFLSDEEDAESKAGINGSNTEEDLELDL